MFLFSPLFPSYFHLPLLLFLAPVDTWAACGSHLLAEQELPQTVTHFLYFGQCAWASTNCFEFSLALIPYIPYIWPVCECFYFSPYFPPISIYSFCCSWHMLTPGLLVAIGQFPCTAACIDSDLLAKQELLQTVSNFLHFGNAKPCQRFTEHYGFL